MLTATHDVSVCEGAARAQHAVHTRVDGSRLPASVPPTVEHPATVGARRHSLRVECPLLSPPPGSTTHIDAPLSCVFTATMRQALVWFLALTLVRSDQSSYDSSPVDEILSEFSGHIVSTEEASSLLDGEPSLVKARSSRGSTALIEAAKAGHTTVCGLLLERGSDVDAVDNAGMSALIYATLCSNQGRCAHHPRRFWSWTLSRPAAPGACPR